MQLPRFFLGLVIVFWGWQTNLWWLALPMMVAYEASFLLNWRWHFTTANFRQVSHFSSAILVAVLIYLWNSDDASLKLIFLFFQWLPVIAFPLLTAQAYSNSQGIDLQALLFFKDKPQAKFRQSNVISLHYPFLAICLIAASAGNTRDLAFYFGLVSLVAIALWFNRSARSSTTAWILIILLAATTGFVGQMTLHQAHLSLEKKTIQWVRQFYRYHSGDPTQNSTAIGDLGSVKQSNDILLRVKPDQDSIAPKLIRKATYNTYNTGLWLAKSSQFRPLELSGKTIDFAKQNQLAKLPQSSKQSGLTIYQTLEEGNNLISLPDGTTEINNLSVEKAERNQYGSVQTNTEETLFSAYQVSYSRDRIYDSPPNKEDLMVPPSEIPAIKEVLAELNLADKSQTEVVETVHNFFNREFSYSLDLIPFRRQITPLGAFLLEHRTGHCEYFATASALILRAAGIPTRYAIGYSVHEYSSLEKQYVIRGKNAHAWNLVYLDGRWQELDPTPASWIAWESQRTSSLVAIQDFFSWIGFKLAQFNALIKVWSQTAIFWVIVIPILTLLIWWLLSRRKMDGINLQRVAKDNQNRLFTGADSEIYTIEQALLVSGLTRDHSESWQHWLSRLEQDCQLNSGLLQELKQILKLHYRYRFDPLGISSQERKRLKTATDSWLTNYNNFRKPINNQD